jgi:hypothetical protein
LLVDDGGIFVRVYSGLKISALTKAREGFEISFCLDFSVCKTRSYAFLYNFKKLSTSQATLEWQKEFVLYS